MSKTIRTITPEMHAALDADREGRLSPQARSAIDTAEKDWQMASHAAHPSHFTFDTAGDREFLVARRRRDGAFRRYITVCHRIGRNYYRPSSLRKRGLSPMMRTAVAAHVREVHEEILTVEGTPPSSAELMCLAALFAAGNDDGQITPGLEAIAAEAARIGFHTADTLETRPDPRLPEEAA